MRKFFIQVCAVLSFSFSATAFAAPADDYVSGTVALVRAAMRQDEAKGLVYRNARLETIYMFLKTAFALEGIPYDTSIPIRVNKEAMNEAAGGAIFISEELLKALDDDSLAFVIAHEMTHLAMNDEGTEMTALTGIAEQKHQAVPSDIPGFVRLVAKARQEEVLPRDFYQGHELRADKTGYLTAKAAGYHPTPAGLVKAFEKANLMTDETYDHPSMAVRAAALESLDVK